MQDTIKKVRAANLKKATQIRQQGYKSAIHALPTPVKEKLDELLSWRISPEKALQTLSGQFPDTKFPSSKAIQNYRNKYHVQSLARSMAVTKEAELLDIKRLKIKNAVANNMTTVATVIFPMMVNRLLMSLEKEQQLGITLKIVNDASRALVDIAEMLQNFSGKNDLRLFATEETTTQITSEDQGKGGKESVQQQLERILSERGFQIMVSTKRSVAVTK